jgi:hypothetical protein
MRICNQPVGSQDLRLKIIISSRKTWNRFRYLGFHRYRYLSPRFEFRVLGMWQTLENVDSCFL